MPDSEKSVPNTPEAKVKPTYNLKNKGLTICNTRLALYMFFPELHVYYDSVVSNAYKLLFTDRDSGLEPTQVYMDDEATKDYDYKTADRFMYHVVVDKSNPHLMSCLSVIEQCPFYIDHYITASTKYCVIRTKAIRTKSIRHMLNSEYSMMWADAELDSLLDNKAIMDLYNVDAVVGNNGISPAKMLGIKHKGMSNAIHVLYESDEMKKMIAIELGLDNKMLGEFIEKHIELDSKYEAEVFNSDHC